MLKKSFQPEVSNFGADLRIAASGDENVSRDTYLAAGGLT